jgi:WD40 repeat protein
VAGDGSLVAGGTSQGLICLCEPGGSGPRILGVDRETSLAGQPLALEMAALLQNALATCRKSSIANLRFSRDGKWLVSAQNNGRVSLWNVATGERLPEFIGHQGPVTAAILLADSKRILSAGLDNTIRTWDIADGREIQRQEFEPGDVKALAVSIDGTVAAWGGYSHKIVIWDLECGQRKFVVTHPAANISGLEFSPDGTLLAAAGTERL